MTRLEMGMTWIISMRGYYNFRVGTFLSMDKQNRSLDLSSPQSWNRYSYAYNNPVRFTDPDGHAPLDLEVKNYRFHYDPGHGGPHIDVSVRVPGGWKKIGRVRLKDFSPIKHKGRTPQIPKAAIKILKKLSKQSRWIFRSTGLGMVISELAFADTVNADEDEENIELINSLDFTIGDIALEMYGQQLTHLSNQQKSHAWTAYHEAIQAHQESKSEDDSEDSDETDTDAGECAKPSSGGIALCQ